MVLCFFAALSSSAYDFEKDGFYYNITSLSDLTVELTKPDNGGYSGDITVPETVEWSSRVFSVTGINETAFSKCNIGTLSIKDNIRKMGRMSWGTIQSFRFEDSEIPLELDEYADEWYWYSGSVDNVYIGRYITAWRARLFGENSGAKSVVFGSKVTSIPSELFRSCSTLKTAMVPDNVKEIGDYSFCETALESFTALGAKTIGTGAFRGCKKLRSVEFSDSLTTITGYTFYNCTTLTDFVLPANSHGLRVIGYSSFEECTALTVFTIPQGVIEIGSYAFKNCSALEKINIPTSVLDFSNVYREYDNQRGNVFKGCTSLKTITMGSAIPVASIENNYEFSTYLSATLKVPVGALENYRSAEGWKNFSDIQEDATISDDICTISITSDQTYDGKVEVSVSDSIGTWNRYIITKAGATATVRAIPSANYKLTTLTINGDDVTEELSDNAYSITITGSMNISISAQFEYDYTPQPEPEPIYLTIKQADNGSIRQCISKWDSFTFYIEPAEGWMVHTITYNGEDISSQVGTDGLLQIYNITDNAILSVSYEQENSSISDIPNSRVKVYSKDDTIIVANAEVGEHIYVYNEAGVNMTSRHTNSAMEIIQVEKGHVYIVKLKGKTVKLSI